MSGSLSLTMTETYAEKFSALALSHITREYPSKLDHILLDADDVKSPRTLHPIFYGSFDWHSSVHGYWLLAAIYRQYPSIPQAAAIRALFDEHFTTANVAVETAYAAHPLRAVFERPYGWAWLLQLKAELTCHETEEGKRWSSVLAPLANVFVRRFAEFLPKATYSIRTGTHFNTAFAVTLATNYARTSGDTELEKLLRDTTVRWYRNDTNASAWEPGGDDFLSPALMEAVCVQRALPSSEFAAWFDRFLPDITQSLPATLFTPATVSDRTDGKIAHLDGLNLSRAWCWRMLALSVAETDARKSIMLLAAENHLRTSLPHVAGDYMGEHWLATFALLALSA